MLTWSNRIGPDIAIILTLTTVILKKSGCQRRSHNYSRICRSSPKQNAHQAPDALKRRQMDQDFILGLNTIRISTNCRGSGFLTKWNQGSHFMLNLKLPGLDIFIAIRYSHVPYSLSGLDAFGPLPNLHRKVR